MPVQLLAQEWYILRGKWPSRDHTVAPMFAGSESSASLGFPKHPVTQAGSNLVSQHTQLKAIPALSLTCGKKSAYVLVGGKGQIRPRNLY